MCIATVDCLEMEIHFPRDMTAHLVTLKVFALLLYIVCKNDILSLQK